MGAVVAIDQAPADSALTVVLRGRVDLRKGLA